jgi:hypothetical protein
MRKKLMTVCCALAMVGLLSGCMTNIHKIGSGAAGSNVTTTRQWYVLWGLVPINHVDTNAIAGGATNYEIKDQQTVLDFVINIFTGFVTVYGRSVTVTK